MQFYVASPEIVVILGGECYIKLLCFLHLLLIQYLYMCLVEFQMRGGNWGAPIVLYQAEGDRVLGVRHAE